MSDDRKVLLLLLVVVAMLVWSGIGPRDRFTWFLEVLPVLMGVPILALTYRRFRFTMFVYLLVTLHAIILMVGGHWTYAEVPLFNWLRDTFGLARNYYDRVGHFAQGFIPAILTREILLRTSPLRRGKWLWFLTISVCLALSAVYELVEWGVAALTGTAADAFLGTQGDVWDTQKDMATCLVGSVAALLFVTPWHDRALAASGVDGQQKQ